MNSLYADLLSQLETLTSVHMPPRVRQLILPDADLPGRSKYTKFGLLELEDHSCGFFYRLSEIHPASSQRTLDQLHRRAGKLAGSDPVMLAQAIESDDEIDAGIGMAALNAITDHLYRTVDYQPPDVTRGAEDLDLWSRAEHLGMVGYFAPTVSYLKQAGIPVTVIELDESLHGSSEGVSVTGDIDQLADTDHIICTASTLLNGSLDAILKRFAASRYFELIGPTCGCLADALFNHGVDVIGGSRVIDIGKIRPRIETGSPWRDSVSKFRLEAPSYPGLESLLARLGD